MCNLDKGVVTCSIFLDLAKAFDSVSHSILIRKLEKYGITGQVLKLFTSYLDERFQFVEIDKVKSVFNKEAFLLEELLSNSYQ